MAASALFSQDIMSSFTDFAPLPRQPQPRHLLQPHLLSARDTTDNHLNHWLSQQYHMQHHQPMGRINTSLASSTRQQEATIDDMGGSDYTFTTHPPNDDALGLGSLGLYMYSNQMPMQQNVTSGPHHSRSAFSNNQWNQMSSYSSANEHTLTAQPYMMGNFSHSQESINNTLSPYLVSTSPSTHMSPTGSDPSLSPLYSASSRLPTPTTPGSTSQSFKRSPTMTNDMLFVMDPAQPESSSGSDRPRYTHREQLALFRDALNLPMDGAGPFIPQMMYKPHTTSDRKRYVEDITLEAPLYFYSEHSTQCGILLKDALQSRTKKLRDRDMVVFEGRGPSVSIRLEWPGYRQWSRQIPTKDFRSPPGPITLAKLAKNVAKCVQRFMQDRKSLPMEEDSDQRWRIGDGPDDIRLEDLVLVSIHHVSLGSWQPHLRLVRPRSSSNNNNFHSAGVSRHTVGGNAGTGASSSASAGPPSLVLPPTPISTTNSLPQGMPYGRLS